LVEQVRVAAAITLGIVGEARVLLLKGSAASVTLLDCRSIDLADPALPQSRQPYYDETGALRKNGPELARLISSVEGFGHQSVTDVIDRYRADGHSLQGLAIIVRTLAHPHHFDNDRMRGHALEQQLFRRVIETASAHRLVPSFIFRAHDLFEFAARARYEERFQVRWGELPDASTCDLSAAAAAWLVLSDSREVLG
jgi:hypothetical protein